MSYRDQRRLGRKTVSAPRETICPSECHSFRFPTRLVAQLRDNRKHACDSGVEFSDRRGMETVVVGNRMSRPRLSFSVKRAASSWSLNRPVSCGKQDKRRHATAPGKLRFTSAAKGIALPAIVRLARRAEYQETGSFSSTEAHQSNPARFVCETSNPDVLSDAINRPAHERGRCGHA